MSIKDLVKHAISGSASDFEDTFSDIMSAKTDAAIEGKFDQMFGEEEVDVEEEYDEFEEAVNEPKSPDEKRFKDKHVIDKKDHPEAEESQFTSTAKKAKRKADREEGEDEKVYEEVEYFDEAKFVPGNMKLSDGSSVKVSREDAKALDELFNQLSGSNKKKMEDRMMESKKGFEEILKFAKETA